MKTRLFSILLMCVFAFPAMAQAVDIGFSQPSYQVDVTSSVVDTGKNEVAAVNVASDKSQFKTTNANAKMTSPGYAETIIISQCASCHSTATGINGVSGGNSIGISKPS